MEEAQRRVSGFGRHGFAIALPVLSISLISAIASSCKKESDEDRVRAVIRKAVEAGNEKRAGEVLEDAAEGFKGPGDVDVNECRRVLVGYFMQAGWIHS